MKIIPFLLALGLSGTLTASPLPFDAQIRNNTLAISPDEHLAVVAYSDTPRVLVDDLAANQLPQVLAEFVTPRNILFAPDGAHFYVSDSSLGEVVEIDAHTLATTRRFALGAGAFGTAITQDGRTLYVNNEAASTVSELDLATGSTTAVITGFAQPRQGIKLSADNAHVFVTNFGSDQVIVVNAATRQGHFYYRRL